MALLLLDHGGQQPHDHLEGAEVVELHGALQIVEAIERVLDGAADGATGIVDEDVHPTMLGHDLAGDRLPLGEIGQIPLIDLQGQSQLGKLGLGLGNLVLVPGDGQYLGPRLGQLSCRGLADTGGGTGDQHHLALDPAAQGTIDEQLGVEVTLPIVARHSCAAAALRCRSPSVPAGFRGCRSGWDS